MAKKAKMNKPRFERSELSLHRFREGNARKEQNFRLIGKHRAIDRQLVRSLLRNDVSATRSSASDPAAGEKAVTVRSSVRMISLLRLADDPRSPAALPGMLTSPSEITQPPLWVLFAKWRAHSLCREFRLSRTLLNCRRWFRL